MQVEMLTEKGVEIITYRVNLTTQMQKVIDKVVVGMIHNICTKMQNCKSGGNEAWQEGESSNAAD